MSENDEEGPKQFHGEVANIQIFEDSDAKHIINMTHCLGAVAEDKLNFETKWTTVGNVEERNEESWKICNRNKTYRVAIPAKMSWNEAIKVCTKLGGGNMTETQNKEDIQYTVSLFENLNSSCNYIWLPLQDEEVEGEF